MCSLYVPLSVGLVPALRQGVVHVFSVCAPVCWSCAGIMWTPWCFVKIFHILLIVTFQFECPHSGYSPYFEYAKIDICYTLLQLMFKAQNFHK